MTGFVSSPPLPASPAGASIEHDGFFPPVDVNALRDRLRLPSQVTHERLVAAVHAAMLTVGRELRVWKLAVAGLAIVNLEDVPSFVIDGQSALMLGYQRAIACFAAAELAETHQDISATGEGRDRAEDLVTTADEHRRNGLHALRDMLGVTRTSVSLI